MSRSRTPVRFNRLYVKILLYFLSLLVPIVLIGTFTYIHFVNQFKRDFTEKMTMNLRSSALAIDNDLRMVQESAVGFLNDSTVVRLFKPYAMYSLQERAEVAQILNDLRRLRSIANDFVDDIFVYIDSSKVYTSAGLVDFEPFFDGHYRFDRYDKSFWLRKLDTAPYVEILDRSVVATPLSQKEVIPLLTSGVVQGNKAVLAASVSIEAIHKTLAGNVAYPNTRFMVMDHDRVLLSSDPEFPDSNAIGEIGRLTEADPAFQGTVSVQGRHYLSTVVRSDIYGWTYYAFTPMSEFNKQAAGIVNMIVVICTVLAVISVLFAFVFTYRIYNPIRHIADILNRKEEGYKRTDEETAESDEFVRIGQGIDRLIGVNQQFRDELHLISAEYLDYALLQLIQGNEAPKEHDIQKMMRNHMGYLSDSFICCTVLFEFKDEFYASIQDVDRILIQGKLKKLIWGMLHDCADLYVLECKQHQYICIFNVDSRDDLAAIRAGLDRFIETFRYDALYCTIHVGVGSIYPGLAGIALSYRDAMADLQSQTSCTDFLTIRAEEHELRYSAPYFFSDENKLLNLLKAGDADGLEETIGDILRVSEQKGVSQHHLNSLISDMYNTAVRFMSERGLGAVGLLSDQEQRQLVHSGEHSADYASRQQLLIRFYHGLAGTIVHQQQAYKSGALVSTIMGYVDEHYDQDLYLEKIADKMNVSVKYVSRVFKDKTGMNITDYISQVRVAKAKELLIHTDMTIYDIAEQVGITNRTTFLRTFKKMEGLSPNEFRKSFASDPNRKTIVGE